MREDGTRGATAFKTKDEAKNFMEVKRADAENLGIEVAGSINDDLKRRLFSCLQKLEPYDARLEDAVDYYVEHLKATRRSEPIRDLQEDFLMDLERNGRGERYVYELRNRLDHFIKDFGDAFASTVTPRMASQWISRRKIGNTSRNHYRRSLSAFFAWCERNGYVQSNPIAKVAKAKDDSSEIEIFTPDQLKTVLKVARGLEDKDILATCLIGAFAGLRAAEISRLDWSDIKIDRGLIDLKKGKAKTAARRIVEIQPNLKAWLKKYFADAEGPIQKPNFTNRLKEFRDDLKNGNKKKKRKPLAWPHNGLRHSFASYLLAANNDPGKTSLQLGHADAGVLFAHYRELVTEEDAKDYWKITP